QQNTRCQALTGLAGCPKRQTDSRRDGLGCRRKEKNGANNLETYDRDNHALEAQFFQPQQE
ncbi:MAG: hypothetical protein ACYC35_02430, partial [Pirellulales bacterium]